MINKVIAKSMPFMNTSIRYPFSATFLRMVESFFDRAAIHTGIRADKLTYYKKAESVLKCSIPLVRGTPFLIQIMVALKPSWLTAVSTKPINYQPKEEPDTPKTSISMKYKPWLAS